MSEKKLKLIIKLHMEHITHSHILKLKEIFLSHPGHASVGLEFHSEEEKILGKIHLGQEWGVRPDGQLERVLKGFPFVKSVQLTSLEF